MLATMQSLWIGETLPPMQRLSIESFLQHGHPYHLYTYGPVVGAPAGTTLLDAAHIVPADRIFAHPQGFGKGSFSSFSNTFRYQLLHDVGGWWVDTDVVCLRPLDQSADFVFATEDHEYDGVRTASFVMRSPPRAPFLDWCLERCRLVDPATLVWGATGSALLNEAIRHHGMQHHQLALTAFGPVNYDDFNRIADPGFDPDSLRDSYAVHLWNQMWMHEGLDPQHIAARDSLYAFLCQRYRMPFDGGQDQGNTGWDELRPQHSAPERSSIPGNPQARAEVKHPHAHRRRLRPSSISAEIAKAVGPSTLSATGNISEADASSLLTLIEQARPANILEVGVASGTSTTMMLHLLERVLSESTLESVDLATSYYAEPDRAVAYLVHEHFAPPPARWHLTTGVGIASMAGHPDLLWADQRRRYDFVFIDAHHGHPWTTLDALCVLPFTVPGSWVALHDINLPLLGAYHDFGPSKLLEFWPLDAVIGHEHPVPNIGAIRLSDAGYFDASHLVSILEQPWDCGVHPVHVAYIYSHLKTFLDPTQLAAVRNAFDRNKDLPDR